MEEITCLYCGEKNNNSNITCKKCGNQLHLKNESGDFINVDPEFVNNVELLVNLFPEYNKKLEYYSKSSLRINNLQELYAQNNYRAIFEDVYLFYRIYTKEIKLKFSSIANKSYQSLDETVVFYATIWAKMLLDKRAIDKQLCNKKNYEIVAFILGFSNWFDRVDFVNDNEQYDNYNSSLSEDEKEYLKVRMNTAIVKNNEIDDNNDIKDIGINNRKRPSLITFSLIIFFVLSVVLYFNFKKIDVEKCKDSVVMITTFDSKGNVMATGSGFCAFDSCYIVTNYHVIENASKIMITTNGQKHYYVVTVAAYSKYDDLAILYYYGNLKPLKIANSDNCKTGDEVIAIGSPKGIINTVSTGIISSLDENNRIRTTAPISPGSSGGVLLNKRGKVIGITYALVVDAQNLNYAITSNRLISLYDRIK